MLERSRRSVQARKLVRASQQRQPQLLERPERKRAVQASVAPFELTILLVEEHDRIHVEVAATLLPDTVVILESIRWVADQRLAPSVVEIRAEEIILRTAQEVAFRLEFPVEHLVTDVRARRQLLVVRAVENPLLVFHV